MSLKNSSDTPSSTDCLAPDSLCPCDASQQQSGVSKICDPLQPNFRHVAAKLPTRRKFISHPSEIYFLPVRNSAATRRYRRGHIFGSKRGKNTEQNRSVGRGFRHVSEVHSEMFAGATVPSADKRLQASKKRQNGFIKKPSCPTIIIDTFFRQLSVRYLFIIFRLTFLSPAERVTGYTPEGNEDIETLLMPCSTV